MRHGIIKRTVLVLCVLMLTILGSMYTLADTRPTKPGASPLKNGSWEVDGTWSQDEYGYQFTDDKGRQYEDEWLQYHNNWYYIGLDHYMKTGWLKDGDNWYYMKPDGTMYKGWMEYDGALYLFSEKSGEMKTSGYWERGSKQYQIASDGTASVRIRSNGENRINSWYFDGSGWVYIKPDWTCVTGRWFDQNGAWYHFDTEGYMQTGWLELLSGHYYLGTDGVMAANTSLVIDGVQYSFGPDGRMN